MFWLNLLVMAILTAGHTELCVSAVNRLHALRIGFGPLRQIRHIHDVLVPAFPIVLLWFVGVRGPAVLNGGSWSDLSAGWTIYLGLCALGAVSLAVSILRWQARKLPALQLSNHSRTIAVDRELGFRPVGNGPFRLLTWIPGNELFQVEVSDKRFRLLRLPESWDGLSILHLSDLHFIGTPDRPYYERIAQLSAEMNADLIVFTGDLLDDEKLLSWFPELFGELQAPLGRYYILGNHDWTVGDGQVRDQFDRLGWQNVSGRTVAIEHKGQKLVIGGTELPWMGKHPDFSSASPDAFRLLLSHSPDNIAWARGENVDLMLSGHVHGGQIVLPVIGPVYGPSRYGVRYASGVFWEDPTLLYVTRGIAGRHPLRWRCPPELTKLVLHKAATES